MPLTVVQIPSLTITTSGTTSSALTNLDDAANLMFLLNSTTTSGANIVTVQVEPTDTGANWASLMYNSSGQSSVTVSSSGWVPITNAVFRQMRMVTTAALAQSVTVIGCRQITV